MNDHHQKKSNLFLATKPGLHSSHFLFKSLATNEHKEKVNMKFAK